jgi:hypothetical protein
VTSLGDESDVSQIQQEGSTDLVWNAFRKLMWIDRDMNKVLPAVEKIHTEVCDDESRLLGVVLGGMMTKSFVLK